MTAEHIKKERLVQKKERLVQLDKALARAFSAITHISDTLLVKEVKDILERAFGKEAISACFGGRASKGTIIYFNIDIDKKF
jgi:predicted ATPase